MPSFHSVLQWFNPRHRRPDDQTTNRPEDHPPLFATRIDDEVYYIHTDHLGSTTLLTDQSGNAVGRADYAPYGRLILNTIPTTLTNRLYTGQQYESDLEIYDYKARFYDPLVGSFLSPDSLVPEPGRPAAWNRYSYVYGNPVRYSDPSGYFPVVPVLLVLAAGYVAYDYLAHPDIAYAPDEAMATKPLPPSDLPDNDAALCSFCPAAKEGRWGAAIILGAVEATPLDEIPGVRKPIIQALDSTISSYLPRLHKIAGQDALIGFRGSLATGIKGPHKLAPDGSRLPFNPNNFDVDAFIVSDKLAALYGNKRMRWGSQNPELRQLEVEIREALGVQSEFEGLRPGQKGFSFRVYKTEEAQSLFSGEEIYFIGDQ